MAQDTTLEHVNRLRRLASEAANFAGSDEARASAFEARASAFNALRTILAAAHEAGNVDFFDEVLRVTPEGTNDYAAEAALRALATIPGELAVRTLLSHAEKGEAGRFPVGCWFLGAALAVAHPVDLLAHISRRNSRACEAWRPLQHRVLGAWLHEAVYHDGLPIDSQLRTSFAPTLPSPLNQVPLYRLPLEDEIARAPPLVSLDSWSNSWALRTPWRESPVDARSAGMFDGIEVSDLSWSRRVANAFRPEGAETNVRVEARRYLLPEPLELDVLGAPVLRVLRPDCITGRIGYADDVEVAFRPPVLRVRSIDAREAFSWFIHCAVRGSCHAPYSGVGPGRARAWDALAAISDLGRDTPWSEIDSVFRQRSFAFFEADSRWFDHECEDLGLLVLDPSRTVLTVIAETDGG